MDPDNIATQRRQDSPARSGQGAIRTNVQHGAGRVFHAAFDVIRKAGVHLLFGLQDDLPRRLHRVPKVSGCARLA